MGALALSAGETVESKHWLVTLGWAAHDQQEFAATEAYLREALDMLTGPVEANYGLSGWAHNNLGMIALSTGRDDLAAQEFRVGPR